MSSPAICDVIILTLDTPDVTERCIASIFKHTPQPGRLIIVNNGGGTNIQMLLESLNPPDHIEKIILSYDHNIGFVRGNNEALKHTRAPYLCLLNSDTLVTHGWLSEMLQCMDQDAQIGLLNPTSNHTGYPKPSSQSVDDWATIRYQRYQGKTKRVTKVSGFCLLMRRDTYVDTQGFDEDIDRAFFEDEDLSLRAKQAGWACAQSLGACIYHQEHASFAKLDFDPQVIFKKNRRWFLNKWGESRRIAVCLRYDKSDPATTHAEFSFLLKPLCDASHQVTIFTNHRPIYRRKKKDSVLFPETESSATSLQCGLVLFYVRLFLMLLVKKKKMHFLVSNSFLFLNICRFLRVARKLRLIALCKTVQDITQLTHAFSPHDVDWVVLAPQIASTPLPSEWQAKQIHASDYLMLRKISD